MHIFLIFTYLLSIVHINGLRIPTYFDETDYNPCATKLGLYFYSHPTDVHKYYQCDETGNAYIRSCGDLVWDELRLACNWPSAEASPISETSSTPKPWLTTTWSTTASSRSPSMFPWLTATSTQSFPAFSWPTATPSWFSSTSSRSTTTSSTSSTTTTTQSLPTLYWPKTSPSRFSSSSTSTTTESLPTLYWPTARPSRFSSSTSTTTESLPTLYWPTARPSRFTSTSSRSTTTSSSSTTTTTTESSSTTDGSSLSLCRPINPCGDHGECIESSQKIPSLARRFACICSENWFGRFCDKPITELTTPSTPLSDQNTDKYETTESFSLPVKTDKESELLFYGLKADNTLPAYNRMIKNISAQN